MTFVSSCLTLLFAALAPSLAVAQVSDADRATARTLAAEAHEAYDKKDYAGAADRFTRADVLIHAPTLTLGLARANVGLGKLVAAQELLQLIVREGIPARASGAFVRAVSDAKKDLELLGSRMPAIIVQVSGSEAPEVTIDGVVLPTVAFGAKRPIDPGKHEVRATALGFEAAVRSFEIAEGRLETVTLALAASREVGPAAPIAAPPVVAPQASSAPPPVAPKAVRPVASAHAASRTPDRAPRVQRTAGIVGLALGGAGLAFGAVTGALAVSKHGSLTSSCQNGICDATITKADLDGFRLVSTLSTVGFLAGGALAVSGVVLLLTAPKNASVAPSVSFFAGPAALGAMGSF